MKAQGYASLTAIYVENVGTDRYYGEFPLVTFRVDVKTAEGPEGVDRLITPPQEAGLTSRPASCGGAGTCPADTLDARIAARPSRCHQEEPPP